MHVAECIHKNMPLIAYVRNESFTALSDPARRDLLALLRQDEQPAGTLVDALQLPQPNVSKHLKALWEAGLVTTRIDGPR
jgi:DNA-binding transcriptional ArsR family regulator